MKKERFKLSAAVYLLLIKDEKILLLRRFNTGWEDGKYSLIAGHRDGDEAIITAMIREAKEEGNISFKPEDLHVVHDMHGYYLNEEYIDFYLIADSWQGEIKNMEKNKCDNLAWFPLNNLPLNTISFIKKALQHYKGNISFSEYGFSNL